MLRKLANCKQGSISHKVGGVVQTLADHLQHLRQHSVWRNDIIDHKQLHGEMTLKNLIPKFDVSVSTSFFNNNAILSMNNIDYQPLLIFRRHPYTTSRFASSTLKWTNIGKNPECTNEWEFLRCPVRPRSWPTLFNTLMSSCFPNFDFSLILFISFRYLLQAASSSSFFLKLSILFSTCFFSHCFIKKTVKMLTIYVRTFN